MKVSIYTDGSSKGNPGCGVMVLFFYMKVTEKKLVKGLDLQQITAWSCLRLLWVGGFEKFQQKHNHLL